jgi:hypothetical protein
MSTDNPKMELSVVLQELEEDWKQGTPGKPDVSRLVTDEKGRQHLPVDAIKRRVAVFQPRSLRGQAAEEHVVLEEIKDAVQRAGVESLDPVIVWWSGKAFYCVDGHHRLIAIQRYNTEQLQKAGRNITDRRRAAQKTAKVPVTILSGTLSEALTWSSRENGKARLSLRKKDRVDWAWKQLVLHEGGVIEGRFVKAQRCRDLHVSRRLLSQMGSAFDKITSEVEPERYPEDQSEVRRKAILALAEVGWSKAQAIAEGREITETWSDDRRAAEIEKIAAKIMSTLGKEAFRSPKAELVAEALLHINDRFAEQAASSPDVHEAFLNAVRIALDADAEWDAPDEEEDYVVA